ncbi:MAG: LamG domain-containing protein [Dysgonamonadaceae bacterium]|jgi:hypothetical protein|nr:LamG domain-containing protein [Dysgonamonadaceae bacterium]
MKRIAHLIVAVITVAAGFTACYYTEYYIEGYIKTADVKNITLTSATCGGEVVIEHKGKDVSLTSVVVRGVLYSADSLQLYRVFPDGKIGDNKYVQDAREGEGVFTCMVDNLEPRTKYYVRAYAQIHRMYTVKSEKGKSTTDEDFETHYGDIKSFETGQTSPQEMTPPTVQTLRVENLKSTSMEIVIELTSLGGDASVSDVGVCLSSSSTTPDVADNERKASGGEKTTTGSFKATFTGLQKSTKYYVRAYAVNSKGTAYGDVLEIATPATTIEVQSGLVAYYTFDSDNCNESQGKTEYNGLLQGTGAPTFAADVPVTGGAGKSLQLNNDAYYYIATSPFNGIEAEFSVSLWSKAMQTNNSYFDHQVTSSYTIRPAITIYNSRVYAAGSSSRSAGFDVAVNSLLLDGNWHLLTITQKSKAYKLYIDGTYIAQTTYNSTLSGNYPLLLGTGFTGKMDNFRVYNRELTQSEITEIYNARQ